jgi:hypothetical protein
MKDRQIKGKVNERYAKTVLEENPKVCYCTSGMLW